MDITYDTIIKYLCGSSNITSDFPTKINLMKYSKCFNKKFQSIFGNNFFRYGVMVYNNEYDNISFWSSILYLLDDKFILLDKSEQLTHIKKFKTQILDNFSKDFKQFELKKKFSAHYTKEKLNSVIIEPITLEFLCLVLKINMLIFNFENNNIYCLNKGSFFNPWLPTILLASYKDYWEPICNDTSKTFCFNDNCIKKTLNEKIQYYNSEYLEKDLTIVDNISEILQNIKTNNNIISTHKDSSNSTFINTIILGKNLTQSKLKKMRKNEIVKLVNDLNIKINIKKPTKEYLIQMIVNNK